MPSPFPGMDPFLEDPTVREEFHHVFITECMYLLSELLPEGYIAKIDERVELVSVSDDAARQYLPDVAVAREASGALRDAADAGVALLPAPVTIPAAESREVREGYIQILRLPNHQLVTSVELLSPWNKFGEGIGQYRSSAGFWSGAAFTLSRSTCSRAGAARNSRGRCRRAITTSWSSGGTVGPTWTCMRGACATGCRRSTSH